MKYCVKCGNPMEDDMLFCQKCGTKSLPVPEESEPRERATYTSDPEQSQQPDKAVLKASGRAKAKKKKKNSSKTAATVMFILAAIYALMSVGIPQMLGMTFFLIVLGLMFIVLSKTPKGSKNIFGKEKGIKKSTFIIICVVAAFVMFGVVAGSLPAETTTEDPSDQSSASNENPSQETHDEPNENDAKEEERLFEEILPDETLENNFIQACSAIGVDAKDISDLEQEEDWMGGPRYSFKYKNTTLRLYCNTDSTINAIKLGTDTDLYKEGYEPYQLADYQVSVETSSNLRMMVEELVESQLNYPKTADFPWLDWSYGRDHNLYSVTSYVTAQNAFGVEEDIHFRAIYYIADGIASLKYFEMNGSALFNEMDTVEIPERQEVAVESPDAVDGEILLIYGQLGEYGQEIDIDGETYINYHVPAGKYMLINKVNYCVVYIASDEYYQNSSGYTTNDIINQYEMSSLEETQTITVDEGEHIELTINARVTLIPED